MRVYPFSEHLEMDGSGCVGLWLQGLLGDVILASAYFDEIRRRYPGRRWIIVHSYREPGRVPAVLDVLRPFFADGRIWRYIYHPLPACVPMPDEVRRLFERLHVDAVVELMFDRFDRSRLTRPSLGLNLDRARRRKAVLMRRSAWNPHFPGRNRPYAEWRQIEERVLTAGYETHLVGIDDTMPLTPGVTDRRHTMSVRELLAFATDAGLVVSCTTFLPVFTQFVCQSLVICDPRDQENQVSNWRVTDRYVVSPARDGYLQELLGRIPPA